jgi:hypothetical protein
MNILTFCLLLCSLVLILVSGQANPLTNKHIKVTNFSKEPQIA